MAVMKWPLGFLSLLFVPLVAGQWTPSPANPQAQSGYPQSSYPQTQYPQPNQYPDASQASQSSFQNPDPTDLQHGVARISIVQGDVNVRRGDNGQLSGAVINAPMLAHDHLETSPGSRAEVQLDAGTMLRLSPNTDLSFADLQYHRAQAQLGLGSIIFRVLPNAATQMEIDTPSIGVRALTQGEYRISVFENGTSQITVRSGQLELSGPRGSERLDSGSSVMVRGDAADPEMQNTAEASLDQFDQWSEDRDREFASPQSAQYVNADVQGAADLDRYGNWVPSGYGQVWRPQAVGSDWSPYSDGQWSYVDYYGWSWIDYSPWGWAPYHYGRWFWNTGYGWCWWPGARGFHSYWSPALVGFFGFGGRAGIGIGFGGLGWVALAPFEIFHSWWGRGGGFYNGYGYRGGYGLAGYRNAGIRGGALIAGVNGFGGIHQRFTPANRGQLAGATSLAGRLPVTATRSSFNYSSRQAVANSRFSGVQSRGFYHSGFQAGAQTRSNFASPSRSYSSPSSSSNEGWRRFGSAAPSASRSSGTGWQPFGRPGASANSFSSNHSSESSGWHPFGQPQSYRSGSSYANPSYQPRGNPRPSSANARPSTQPHYSAPSPSRSSGGGGTSHGGGGSSHSSGGGGHHR